MRNASACCLLFVDGFVLGRGDTELGTPIPGTPEGTGGVPRWDGVRQSPR